MTARAANSLLVALDRLETRESGVNENAAKIDGDILVQIRDEDVARLDATLAGFDSRLLRRKEAHHKRLQVATRRSFDALEVDDDGTSVTCLDKFEQHSQVPIAESRASEDAAVEVIANAESLHTSVLQRPSDNVQSRI